MTIMFQPATVPVIRALRPPVYTLLKIVQHVVASAHRERHNRHCRRLVSGARKNAGIANIKIRNVVRLRPLVRY